jgi:very-short-patch-repair endonuclease
VVDVGMSEPPSLMEEVVRKHAIALYTFLKEFTELRMESVRSIDSYDQVLWLDAVPREPGCSCAVWHRGREEEEPDVWLEVKKPRLIPPPTPPAELAPWLSSQWEDSEAELPELRDEIAAIGKDSESQPVRLRLADHPQVKALWEAYVPDRWWPWREQDRRAQAVQQVYTDLFRIYQKQQRLGEQYEVILGLGLLKWRLPTGLVVERHVIAASATLRFDASRGVIAVGPAAEGAKPILEQDMLDPADRPPPDQLRALEAQVAEIGDMVWDPASVDAALAAWTNSMSARGTYAPGLSRPTTSADDPQVHLAPALILRKRTDRSFLRAFQEILQQLRAGAPVPEGVVRFVSVVEPPSAGDGAETVAPPGIASEVYFPLESNEDQLRIVDRLANHQGVLVQGPPGTGKSHTIVNLVAHLLATGQRVLVTSHTPRALRVLKRYIKERVPEIAPLAVLLLGEGSDAIQAMEDSVQGITQKQNHWNPTDAPRIAADLERALSQARQDQTAIRTDLRSIREKETCRHGRVFGSYEGTLSQIATRLRREEVRLGWLVDQIPEERETPVSSSEFRELLGLLRDPSVSRLKASGHAVPDPSRLPTPDEFAANVAKESVARAALSGAPGRGHPAYPALRNAPVETRQKLASGLQVLLAGADRAKRHMHPWAERAAVEILGGHDRAWSDLRETTELHAKAMSSRAKWADENAVTWKQPHDHRQTKADAENLLGHVQAGGRWGFGPFRPRPVKRALYLMQDVQIGGQSCDTVQAIRDLIEWLRIEERAALLRKRWAPYHRVLAGSFSAQAAEFLDLCEPLADAVNLHQHVEDLRPLFQFLPGVPEPTWHDVRSVEALVEATRAADQDDNLRAIETDLVGLQNAVASAAVLPNACPQVRSLLSATTSRDAKRYQTAFEELSALHATTSALQRREVLLQRIATEAPQLASSLAADPSPGSWDTRADDFVASWNWSRARAWLARLSAPAAEERLRLRLDHTGCAVRRRLAELASTKAWQQCFERMREHERQHLVAWAKAMRAIGRGTGKYAPLHRRNAREHMNECRAAIPAWVMPLYRVAETIRPGTDLFDVVIVDEASQSGPEALLLAYMAKKVVVVGDDKQISPTHLGIDREDVHHIRERHLQDLPHKDSYGVDHSFFDLAEIRYPGRIRLREHFRCMPEIIQFSNNLCYQAEPLIPLRQYGAERLSPVVGAQYVSAGYLKGSGHTVVNPAEAEALVAWIVRALADPQYKQKSFGVISLLGEPQAREVERLILQRVGPEEMERRQLICGDAYAFQGDERDVIVLSMVSAPDPQRRISTLTSEADRRRFNVAASRARDQMLLFHSVTPNDLSAKCLRYQLLEYCQNPTVAQSEIAGLPLAEYQRLAQIADRAIVRPPEPFESWFEVDVFLQIAGRGFRVLPQYGIAGYRIDLVVEGVAQRVAVECDGDHWHGPDRYESDSARQRVLERCGWRFVRIRESAFRFNSDNTLAGLWRILEQHGVWPSGASHASGGLHDRHASEEEQPSELTTHMAASRDAPGTDDVDTTDAQSADPPARSTDGECAYHEWQAQPVPNAADAPLAEVLSALVSIVEQEGPMMVHRACRLYVKASGGQRVGKLDRFALHKALRRGAQQGMLVIRNESATRDLDEHVVRRAGAATAIVRRRGPRDFSEIPPSEIAALLSRLASRNPGTPDTGLYREVLAFYETRRLTANIEGQLTRVSANRAQLLDDGVSQGS